MPELSYSEALTEATLRAMEKNESVLILGEGVDDPKGVFGTTRIPFQKFGGERVMDSPLSEAALTGIGIGAALEGRPVIMVHQRNEFMLYAMDQIVNHAAKWRYMSGGRTSVPVTIRALIGRGWGQAAQHSQSFHGMFAAVPGLKVILPATPLDALHLLQQAIEDPNPVLCLEHRWLYGKKEDLQHSSTRIELGKARVLAEGGEVTCVALSQSVYDALEARERLAEQGIDLEVIDLHTVRPLDMETIAQSVKKTGRIMVVDIGPKAFGVGAEISAQVIERLFVELKQPPIRVGLPDCPTPCSASLEQPYYPGVGDITAAALQLMGQRSAPTKEPKSLSVESFTGPF